MANVNKDRATLKRLVESYGKQDVLKFINHLNENESLFDDIENTVRTLQQPIARNFIALNAPFKEFISEDYEQDEDGYIYMFPDTLWNGGPVEEEFIEDNWMPRGDYILSPALLINPDTQDVKFVVGYSDEDGEDQENYEVNYSNAQQFANDFMQMYAYTTRHHETMDHIITHWMNGATKIW